MLIAPMAHVIVPPLVIPEHGIAGPVFFLAGPIRGGAAWRDRAAVLIAGRVPDAWIVSPAYGEAHAAGAAGEEGPFPNQTLWERHLLERASRAGCILFWLPAEDPAAPRAREHGPYAQDTYGELGEWRGRAMADPGIRLVIGAEADFPGLATLAKNTRAALGEDFPIHATLEETVAAAIARAASA